MKYSELRGLIRQTIKEADLLPNSSFADLPQIARGETNTPEFGPGEDECPYCEKG